MTTDAARLRESIDLAHEALRRGDAPFGAVVVSAGGAVLARGRNEVVTADDPTAHAETVAMLAVPAGSRSSLAGATVYASGEPCPMCSAAMVWAGVGRIVFATSAQVFGRVVPASPSFALTCADVVGASDADLEVVGPALEEEGLAPFREAAQR